MEIIYAIKFNGKGKVYYFKTTNNSKLNVNDKIVVSTSRGREIASVIKDNVNLEDFSKIDNELTFERLATEKDIERMEELNSKKNSIIEASESIVKKLKMNIKIVEAEFTLEGNKVIISFVCDNRVDFRELVKELAQALKLKIELKQIGSRDHAKIVGGIGPCGQVCCCIRYINDFDKVSVKMAKQQNLSLNPAKISGLCGKLMCCLSYENEQYIEISKSMPAVHSRVKTPDGVGVVIYNNIIKEKSTVKIENGDEFKIIEFKISDIDFDKNNTLKKKHVQKNDNSVNNSNN